MGDLQSWERKREDAILKHKKANALAVKMTGEEGQIVPKESKEQLNAKITVLKKLRENAHKEASNLEQIKEDCCKLQEEVKRCDTLLKCQKLYVKEVKEMNEERHDMIIMIRRRIVNMVTRKFNHIT